MARRSAAKDPESTRVKLIELLEEAPNHLASDDIGEQVNCLVEISSHMRELGASIGTLLAGPEGSSGRARILGYLRHQVGRIVHTDELMIVAGIGDYPRRIRELRADFGWPILSGLAVRDMLLESNCKTSIDAPQFSLMAPEEYILVEDSRDQDAVRRWTLAPSIKASNSDPKARLKNFIMQSLGQRVTAEELRSVSGNDSAWPSLLRSLQQDGVTTRSSIFGNRELPPGIFVSQLNR